MFFIVMDICALLIGKAALLALQPNNELHGLQNDASPSGQASTVARTTTAARL